MKCRKEQDRIPSCKRSGASQWGVILAVADYVVAPVPTALVFQNNCKLP